MYLETFITDVIGIAILTLIRHFIPWKDNYISMVYYFLIALAIIEFPIGSYFKYKVYTYKIDEDCVYVKEGFLTIVKRVVPIERIHNIEIEKGPILRLFHLAKVTLITAGGKIEISMLEEAVAESISQKLRDKINNIVRNQRQEDFTKTKNTTEYDKDNQKEDEEGLSHE